MEDVPEERATESMVAADEASMEESEPSLQDAAEEAQTESSAQMKVDEKTDTTIPRLILPTKVYVSTVAQLKEEKTSKRSPSAERIATTTRPTQVPPLVFPLANMFEERMPLPMVPTNGGSSTTLFTPPPAPPSSSTASVSADNHNLTSPSWDPSENASYVLTFRSRPIILPVAPPTSTVPIY